jgi:hypothetical protein
MVRLKRAVFNVKICFAVGLVIFCLFSPRFIGIKKANDAIKGYLFILQLNIAA